MPAITKQNDAEPPSSNTKTQTKEQHSPKERTASGSQDQNKKKNRGLSTRVALARLHNEIEEILKDYEKKAEKSCYRKLRSAFVKRYDSPLGWLSIGTTLLTTLALLLAQIYLPALVLLGILLLDLFVVIRENNFRSTEIFRKTRHCLAEIKLAEQELCGEWQPNNYPHLCCPMSPCVSLQWTYRDGVIVNLPWALLVKGDYIVLRPGHITPGPCKELNGKREFNAHEIYGVAQVNDPPVKPVARAPLPDLVCVLENTPYLDNLRIILENSHKRPPTIYNQQRYLERKMELVTKYIQQWGFLFALIVTFLAGLVRINGFGLPDNDDHHELNNWRYIFIESSAAAVIPLLPLVFPLMWIALNLWGIARLQCFLRTPQILIVKDSEKSFEEDLDSPSYDYQHISLMRANVFRTWLELWYGNSELLPRTANVVQVLGSITALCCVDKKGILSWPNPTAEKVFFLRDSQHDRNAEDKSDSQSSLDTDSDQPIDQDFKDSGVVAEVLDLTHDQHCPFRLEFDDHTWKHHIKSLKPLGLAILLNTCSPLTHTHYAQFCGHVTAVAMLDKDLVPVTNRRCLCELAKQIGFTDHATDSFTLEGQLASYRHLQPDVLRRDIRFARQLQLSSKVKVPFPHSLSVVMRENPGGYLSLFTQGTADIVLDFCDDFWDGRDLRPLSAPDRKRALDFYQRSALTAYCTAFSYRPLRHSINGALSGANHAGGPIAYLELPPETKLRMQHVDKAHCDYSEHEHAKLSHSISTDSLLYSESKDEDINDVEGCFEMQCHQIFIGMVTMQYQAQTDIVQLVERLERACIRFVHFSKENELRSRVFSEKMGLESGWNCHISLLSEADDRANTTIGSNNGGGNEAAAGGARDADLESDLNFLIPPTSNLESSKNLSSSAPGAISNHELAFPVQHESSSNASLAGSQESINGSEPEQTAQLKQSQDSAMDENCRSLSIITESTEQSAPVNFDMSNRAKLPRGIENIRPHLEEVDNVPLQVSLFTDCSAEATKQMLDIMQSYGEIVVCLGSSASNSNAEIFLQADCSIAVEPLYPQVCQDIDAYTESNIFNNKLRLMRLKKDFSKTGQDGIGTVGNSLHEMYASEELLERGLYGGYGQEPQSRPMCSQGNTVSPIYLSRLLNSLPCSISICRDDPLSLVAIIELSRRFSSGLWNCFQYWACCAGSLALLNMLCACLSLPPILTPLMVIYIMCIPVPLISLALAHIDADPKIMNRATGKKQTEYDSRVFGFVVWCYGCKFISPILLMLLSYCTFMAHPLEIIDVEDDNFKANLDMSRNVAFLGILLHFIVISVTFVHRDHSLWRKHPFNNRTWSLTCCCILIAHIVICLVQITVNSAEGDHDDDDDDAMPKSVREAWPAIAFLYSSSLISLLVAEIAKWQEIKVNTRYQRRARLDFGTKLGMNSPF